MTISHEMMRQAILAMDPHDLAEDRYGPRVAKKLHGIFKNQPRADAPMNRVYFDNTQMDLYVVVSTENGQFRKVRPWLTLVSDDHTGMVVGFAMSFQAPKAEEVLAALRHTILPKTYTERWLGSGLKLPWEVMGIPDEIVIDNGLDLQANAFYTACTILGISVTTTPPMEPWRKGRCERIFGTLNTKLFHLMPGSTFGKTDNKKKHEYNPQDFACLTPDELMKALHITFEEMACGLHNGINDIPLRRWRAGVKRFPLRMPLDIQEFNAQVSLRETRVIGRSGIEYKGLQYADENLVNLRRTLGNSPRVTILVRPEDLREIYVVDPATSTVVPVCCTQRFDGPMPLFLHEIMRQSKKDPTRDTSRDNEWSEDEDLLAGSSEEGRALRRGALNEIEKTARARLLSIKTDKSAGKPTQLTALDMRQAMEPPRAAPDNRAARILRGQSILAMPGNSEPHNETDS